MNKQEVIDYVMSTPHNVNRTILSQSLDEIGTQADWNQIVDITDKISKFYFDFSAVDTGLYWSSSISGINIGGSYVSGLFVVLKMTDTIANVWAVHTGTSFVCNNGTISSVKTSLMAAQDYYDLTTTSKQIIGAINEINEKLTAIAEAGQTTQED